MEDIKTNLIAGVSVLNSNDIENLIRDSERLAIITEYVKNTKYIDKSTLLVLLGYVPENK